MEDNPYHAPTIPAEGPYHSPTTGFFVQRRVENGEQIVVLPYLAVYWWVKYAILLVILWAWINSQPYWTSFVACGGVAGIVALGLPYWSIQSEVKQRMKVQPVTVQGSRYSFSNPITYRWTMTP